MTLIRKLFVAALMLCAMQGQAEVMAGRDYQVLKPAQPTSSGNKVEVLEFFFYGCPHCFHLHGPLTAWENKLPADVELQPVPVIFRDSWEPMARTFYALEAMGERKRLHDALFDAWNVQNTDLSDEKKIVAFLAKHGVDTEKFSATYKSFALAGKLARANQLVHSYRVRGTPTIAVDGKYIITGLGPEDTVRVLNEVVEIARKERQANKR